MKTFSELIKKIQTNTFLESGYIESYCYPESSEDSRNSMELKEA